MKFTISTTTLAETVNAVANGLPNNHAIPILGGILVEPAIGAVTLNSYDYDRSISVTAGADVGDTGDPAVVSGRLLATVAKLLPGSKQATISTDHSSMLIECGKATFALPLMHAADYPQMPSDTGITLGRIDSRDLVSVVDTVNNFTAKPPVNPAEFVAIHAETRDNGELILSATDRFTAILARATGFDAGSAEPVTINIPGAELAKALAPWRKSFGVAIDLALDGGTFITATTAASSTLRTMEPEFPRIATLFPTEFACICRIGAKEAIDMLGRVAAFANSRDHARVTLTVTDGAISARNLDGEGIAQDGIVNSEFTGKPREFTVNPNKLSTIIGAMGTPTVALGFTTTGRMAATYPGLDDIPDAADAITPLSFDRAALVMGIRP